MTDHVRFLVRACADPQTLLRVVNEVARLGLVPHAVRAHAKDGILTIVLEQPDIDDGRAQLIAEKMGLSVLVKTVSLRRGRRQISLIGKGAPN